VSAVLVVLAAFIAMEPLTYLAHRYVMHGLGRRLHRSHHRRWAGRAPGESFFEANDAFPAVFAGSAMVAFALGFNVDVLGLLVPITVGVTLYGVAYALVHDGYIHGRLPAPSRRPTLDRLAAAHELHHRFGGEPYGMLVPIVPASVRARAAAAPERELTRSARR
jgi:beta-carotene 3-hydroxylase